MKTNHYESVVIYNANLEDEQIEAAVKRILEFHKANESEILDVDKWGRRRLAYPIKNAKSGYYVVYRFKSNRDFIAKLERAYRLDEIVIRYITVSLDKEALEFIAKSREAKPVVEGTEDSVNKQESSENSVL
jgi:small subunit ribosomal protein S6